MNIYLRGPEGKTKALTFSYDDGVEQDIRLMEILDKHNMKGTFNINSGSFAPEGTVYAEGQVHRRMTKSMCERVYANHEVAVHTLTHPRLDEISEAECRDEVTGDRINLEKLTGGFVRGMAYPYGVYNDSVINTLKECGIVYSRTVEQTMSFDIPKNWLRLASTCKHTEPELMTLADKFLRDDVKGKDMLLFYVWGHAYEFEGDNNWEVIENFTEYMANKDDVWYATNIEIYDYITAYNRLVFDAQYSKCYNPTATKLWFATENKIYSIDPGATVTL